MGNNFKQGLNQYCSMKKKAKAETIIAYALLSDQLFVKLVLAGIIFTIVNQNQPHRWSLLPP